MDKETAPAKATFSAAGIAAAFLMGAWCGPAIGASGIDIACDGSSRSLDDVTVATSSSLAAHTESALAEILDDDAVKLPALADAVTNSDVESSDDQEEAAPEAVPASETPAIITRLPAASDSVLPSFRRQMYRTDI